MNTGGGPHLRRGGSERSPRARGMKVGLLSFVAVPVLISGCSFLLVKGPSTIPQPVHLSDCTASYAPPVVDTVLVGTVGLGVAWGAAQGGPALTGPNDFAHLAPAVALGAAVATVAASAIYGYLDVHDCRAASTKTMLPPPLGAP
jgi:hypothetical protein